ncbi:MAG: aminotransferase class I/II-fold pyridoxal phosphate-dependent enzyme [Aggregatilineales bacterium]
MPAPARRVASFGNTVFSEINALARQHNAVNLGQGMPDFDGPAAAIEAAVTALRSGANQYAPGPGIEALRQAVASHALRFYNLRVDPADGVLVTPGATEAVFCAIMGLVDPGDEVIIIEPFFDSYAPGVLMAGARPVYVPLHPPEWTFDPAELRAAFSARTRAVIVNTPHNPTGRVFTYTELALIADLCQAFDVTVISDEVYEHLVYDDARHIPIATLPGMFSRTVTIGSAGKTFGMTGWKVGWAYGPPELIGGVWRAHQFVTFATNHPAQHGVAHAFTLDNTYYESYQNLYRRKRALLLEGLTAAGFKVIPPEGTYFVMADFSGLFSGDADSFARYMIEDIGVACIPPGSFYSPEHRSLGDRYVRFAFCKNDGTLREAARRLMKLLK